MTYYYILDEERNPVPLADDELERWALWHNAIENRRVGSDEFEGVSVSTVFLGTDHDFSRLGPPVLFESMVFGGDYDNLTFAADPEPVDPAELSVALVGAL